METHWMDTPLFTLAGTATDVRGFVAFLGYSAAVLGFGWLVSRVLRERLTILEAHDRRVTSRFVFWVIAAYGLMGTLARLGLDLSAPLMNASGLHVSVLNLVTFATFVATVLIGSNLVRKLSEQTFLTRLEPGVRYAISRILYYVMLCLGLLAALQTVGLELSSLTVAVGALSVGIGFGLQNIVNNFVSGLILLFERPVQVGDWIEVEGTSGRITQIGARSLTVVTGDNISILVPNALCLSSQVTNWSHGDPKVRLRVPVGVAYGSDMDKVERVLLEVARNDTHALKDPEPLVLFNEFGDSSLNVELAVWIDIRESKLRKVRSDLNFAINRAFARESIEIPFPQRDLHLRSSAVPLGPARA